MRKYGISLISMGLRSCLFRGSTVGRGVRLILTVAGLLFLMIKAIGWQWNEDNQGMLMDWRHLDLESFDETEQNELRPNETWIKIRQDLLGRGSQRGVSKAILFSYMRGGSTLFSHVFDIDPKTTLLWYEALDAFHAHYSGLPIYSNTLRLHYDKNLRRRLYTDHTRPLDREKILAMTDYLAELLTCDSDRIPIETLTHRFISNLTALAPVSECMSSYIPLVFATRQRPLSIAKYMKYETHPYLKIVSSTNLSRFFLRSDLEEIAQTDSMEVFRKYFKQVEDWDLKEIVYGSCGEMWDWSPADANISTISGVELVGGLGDRGVQQTDLDGRVYSEIQCQEILEAFDNFLNVTLFMQSVNRKTRHCRDVLRSACKDKGLVVAEIHRASMLDLEPLIQRMPDVHVIFYARDPRAMAVSRVYPMTRQIFLNGKGMWSTTDEARLLCRKMWSDLRAVQSLERRYPGAILTVRYEDFLLNPRHTVARMYDQLLRRVPAGFDQWVNETMNAAESNGVYGIKRSKSLEHASKWRSKVNYLTGHAMTQDCLKVVKELGYEY